MSLWRYLCSQLAFHAILACSFLQSIGLSVSEIHNIVTNLAIIFCSSNFYNRWLSRLEFSMKYRSTSWFISSFMLAIHELWLPKQFIKVHLQLLLSRFDFVGTFVSDTPNLALGEVGYQLTHLGVLQCSMDVSQIAIPTRYTYFSTWFWISIWRS